MGDEPEHSQVMQQQALKNADEEWVAYNSEWIWGLDFSEQVQNAEIADQEARECDT